MKQMALFDKDAPAHVAIRKSEWRLMSTYKGEHALFWGINASTEYGEFIVSGHPDFHYGNIDEPDVDWREHLVDDFGRRLSGLGEIHFWQPYPKKLKGVEK